MSNVSKKEEFVGNKEAGSNAFYKKSPGKIQTSYAISNFYSNPMNDAGCGTPWRNLTSGLSPRMDTIRQTIYSGKSPKQITPINKEPNHHKIETKQKCSTQRIAVTDIDMSQGDLCPNPRTATENVLCTSTNTISFQNAFSCLKSPAKIHETITTSSSNMHVQNISESSGTAEFVHTLDENFHDFRSSFSGKELNDSGNKSSIESQIFEKNYLFSFSKDHNSHQENLVQASSSGSSGYAGFNSLKEYPDFFGMDDQTGKLSKDEYEMFIEDSIDVVDDDSRDSSNAIIVSKPDDLMQMMKKIEKETEQLDADIKKKVDEQTDLKTNLAYLEFEEKKLLKEQLQLKKELNLLEIQTNIAIDPEETEESKFILHEEEDLTGLHQFIHDLEREHLWMDRMGDFLKTEKKDILAHLNTYAEESIELEKKYGPAKKLEEATKAKEDALKEYLELIEKFGTKESLTEEKNKLAEKLEALCIEENNIQEEISTLENILIEREQILEKLNIDEYVSINRDNAKKIRLERMGENSTSMPLKQTEIDGENDNNTKKKEDAVTI